MNEDNHILECCQQFHQYNQYIVDMYANIEIEDLMFIGLNQIKLCSEKHVYSRDVVLKDGNTTNAGRLTILPS